MKKSLLGLVMGSLLLTQTAFANSHGSLTKASARAFYDLIENFRGACATECQRPFSFKVIFNLEKPEPNDLSATLLSRLQKAAFEQAQVWGDTILEGDYYSDGKTRLDTAAALYKNGQLIGYKIQYSERAWDTAECDFNEFDENTLNACAEGRIQEAGFISSDFNHFFRDEDRFATFLN